MRDLKKREIHWGERGRIILLDALPYSRNISFTRIRSLRVTARHFFTLAASAQKPDVIVCAVPTLDLACATTRYGKKYDVPVVLDYRDLWPDVFQDLFPRLLRPLVRVATEPFYRLANEAFPKATSVTGITSEFVDLAMKFAGRARGALDREFPLGYPDPQIDSASVREAFTFWKTLGLAPDDGWTNFCFIGSLSNRMELPVLRDAFRELENRGSNARIVICGVGEMWEDVVGWSQTQGNLVAPGFIQTPQIAALMKLCRGGLIPYPSTPDFVASVPNKAIEYMAGGLPIISSVQGVLKRLLEQEKIGMTYRNGDPAGLADIVERLTRDDSLRSQLSAASRSLFENRFDAKIVYADFVSHLECVGTRRRTS